MKIIGFNEASRSDTIRIVCNNSIKREKNESISAEKKKKLIEIILKSGSMI